MNQIATPPEPEVLEHRRRRGRRILLALLAVSLLPAALALTLHLTEWRPGGKAAHFGELINPARPLPESPLKTHDGQSTTLAVLRGHWLLLAISHGDCEAVCRNNLRITQQVRHAQGQHMNRIERVVILVDARVPDRMQLARDFPGLRVLVATPGDAASLWRALDSGTDSTRARGHVYLVDPLGNLVLRYAPDADPSGMRKDLARLLRLSQIG